MRARCRRGEPTCEASLAELNMPVSVCVCEYVRPLSVVPCASGVHRGPLRGVRDGLRLRGGEGQRLLRGPLPTGHEVRRVPFRTTIVIDEGVGGGACNGFCCDVRRDWSGRETLRRRGPAGRSASGGWFPLSFSLWRSKLYNFVYLCCDKKEEPIREAVVLLTGGGGVGKRAK